MNVRDISIIDYLSRKGFKITRRGNKWFTSSPYSNDRTPSFCIFPDNAFKDFSSGKAGNIITLAKFFGDDIRDLDNIKPWIAPKIVAKKPFNNSIPYYYTNIDESEKNQVQSYADSRKLTNYISGTVKEFREGNSTQMLSVIFPHQDLDGSISGAKFRFIQPLDSQRFTSRGVLGYYLLEPPHRAKDFVLVEGEANCDSLYTYFQSVGRLAVVACSGGVHNIPKELPYRHKGMRVKLIIDYDGDEDKFNYRTAAYNHLNPEIIKIPLDKGVDINDLSIKGTLHDTITRYI